MKQADLNRLKRAHDYYVRILDTLEKTYESVEKRPYEYLNLGEMFNSPLECIVAELQQEADRNRRTLANRIKLIEEQLVKK